MLRLRFHLGCPQGHRQRDWYDEDDATNQGCSPVRACAVSYYIFAGFVLCGMGRSVLRVYRCAVLAQVGTEVSPCALDLETGVSVAF